MFTRTLFFSRKLHANMNSVKVKIIIRTECTNKKGEAPLALQAFINSKRLVIPLKISIDPKYFDRIRQSVKPSHPLALQINSTIRTAIERSATIQAQANTKNQALDKNNFRNQFLNIVNDYDFIAFCTQEIEKRYNAKEITPGTYRQHKSSLLKFSQYKSSIPITEMNTEIIAGYEAFLRKSRKNNTNTIRTALKNINTYLNRLSIYDIEIKNPFAKYRIKTAESQRSYLELDELTRLLEAYRSNYLMERLRGSLLLFLFSCFTSLRISDAQTFQIEINSMINDDAIILKPIKTLYKNKQVKIPLNDASRYLIDEVKKHKYKFKTDQKVNEDLKQIAAYVGLNKNISFKTARHTFATIFLQLGGKVEVLQSILGHTDIKTTMIYVHIADKTSKEQMQNFNQLINKNDGTI